MVNPDLRNFIKHRPKVSWKMQRVDIFQQRYFQLYSRNKNSPIYRCTSIRDSSHVKLHFPNKEKEYFPDCREEINSHDLHSNDLKSYPERTTPNADRVGHKTGTIEPAENLDICNEPPRAIRIFLTPSCRRARAHARRARTR